MNVQLSNTNVFGTPVIFNQSTPNNCIIKPSSFPYNGVVAYYKLDNSYADSTTNYPGTGTPGSFGTGLIGSAALIGPATMSVNQNFDPTVYSGSFTIAFWLNPVAGFASLGTTTLLWTWGNFGGSIDVLTPSSVAIKYDLRGDPHLSSIGGFTGTIPITASIWNHIVLAQVSPNISMSLWVNGVKDTLSYSFIGGIGTSSFSPRIGAGILSAGMPPSNSSAIGSIDEFGIWNRVLTGAEVGTLYNSGSGITY